MHELSMGVFIEVGTESESRREQAHEPVTSGQTMRRNQARMANDQHLTIT